ncbi:MAG: class I SAM-dependent methyltransferase [Luteimonas sp.]
MNRLPIAALPALLLVACAAPSSHTRSEAYPAPQATQAEDTSLDAAIAGPWRSPADAARDQYRHPRQTLDFFGVRADQTVIEITPGGGWYAQILAPYLSDRGHYVAALAKPDRPEGEAAGDKQALATKFAADPTHFGRATTVEFDPKAPGFGPPASADVVLTFRNVHNWVMSGTQAAMFRGFFDVLKPGGVLGVTDHRANAGAATDGGQGYVTEQQVIDYATAAGFVLDGRSDINANPRDRKDYPKGVWTLPPTFALGDTDRATYLAIGESDRMTLRFRKPR